MDPQEEFLRELEAHKAILYKVARVYCANPADRADLSAIRRSAAPTP